MSVTAPKGFIAAGMHAGVKTAKLDFALLVTDDGKPVPCAAVFTQNRFRAPPVEACVERLAASGGGVITRTVLPGGLRIVTEAMPGVRFVNIFGQTEGSPITCLTPDDHVRAAAGRADLLRSVGRAAPGVELMIERPDDDGVGEVVARAEHLFKPDEDGWLRTGDLGRVDAEGYLHLSGRRGDKIIRGGENVYPMEVEHVLAQHPDVAEACVFGIADRTWGEIVAAAVVAADPSRTLDTEALRAFARERLASFKVPVDWEQVDALPRNATGKVVRRDLVARRAVE